MNRIKNYLKTLIGVMCIACVAAAVTAVHLWSFDVVMFHKSLRHAGMLFVGIFLGAAGRRALLHVPCLLQVVCDLRFVMRRCDMAMFALWRGSNWVKTLKMPKKPTTSK